MRGTIFQQQSVSPNVQVRMMRACARERSEMSEISIPITEGAGTIIKGDRVKWCNGLEGTVLGVWKSLVMIETDDGITRLAGEQYITLAHDAPAREGERG